MKIWTKGLPGWVFLSVGLLGGCDRPPDHWTPVLEETSTTFLETETNRALDGVQSALADIQTDPGRAEASLEKAETSLLYLRDFYLPLFQARERSYNAYRYFRLGNGVQVDRELELIEETLRSMVDAAGGAPHREIQELAEAVAAARIAARGEPEEAGAALEALARRLEQVVVKGDLLTGGG
jgi:hypothetical protein